MDDQNGLAASLEEDGWQAWPIMRAEPALSQDQLDHAERRKREKSRLVIDNALLTKPTAGPGYYIRPMQFRDCASCFHLGEKVFTSQFPNLYRQYGWMVTAITSLWDEYEVVDAFSSYSNKCFVAVTKDEKLIGFIFGDEIRKKNSWRYGYIHWIAVDPLFRRRGIGTELYNRVAPLMHRKDGVRLILCDTPADNHMARRFFEKLGFGDPINHVYMSRNLSQFESNVADSTHHQATQGGTNGTNGAPNSNGGSGNGSGYNPMDRRATRRSGSAASAPAAPLPATASSQQLATLPKKKKKFNLTVREMIIDDLHEVYELGEGVFGDRSSPNLFRFWEPAEVLDLFETDSEFCLVAEIDEAIVGFCLGTTIKKKKSAWKYGYLIWLGVAPNYQGAGIGLALYEHFQQLAVADGARMVFIDTQADSPAVKFWKRQGFGHAQAHVFMSKSLAGAADSLEQHPDSAREPPPDLDELADHRYYSFAEAPVGKKIKASRSLSNASLGLSRAADQRPDSKSQAQSDDGSSGDKERRWLPGKPQAGRSIDQADAGAARRSTSSGSTPEMLAIGSPATHVSSARGGRRTRSASRF